MSVLSNLLCWVKEGKIVKKKHQPLAEMLEVWC